MLEMLEEGDRSVDELWEDVNKVLHETADCTYNWKETQTQEKEMDVGGSMGYDQKERRG